MDESIDIIKILSLLPHRYPFILVDKVLDFKPFDYLVGIKNVTMNEPFFTAIFQAIQLCPECSCWKV